MCRNVPKSHNMSALPLVACCTSLLSFLPKTIFRIAGNIAAPYTELCEALPAAKVRISSSVIFEGAQAVRDSATAVVHEDNVSAACFAVNVSV